MITLQEKYSKLCDKESTFDPEMLIVNHMGGNTH
jgi:hypothetical protein